MTWTFFPLYGLTITEPDAALDDPLFKDATIVSRTALQDHLSTLIEPQAVPIMSHAKLSGILGPEGMAKIPMPMGQLVEIEPPSFIAVRDRRDPQENLRRATEIRALLSATLTLRGHRSKTFSGTPTQVAWFITPGEVNLRGPAPPQTSVKPVINEHVVFEPLQVSRAAIRKSVKDGSVIPNNQGWDWDLHESHPVCQLFLLSKITKFQKRLVNVAIQIQEAGCSPSYETQIQGTVAALEVLLKQDSFSELKKMVKAFFAGSEQAERVDRLVSMRHKITHEGGGRDVEVTKELAQHGLMMAWMMLDFATAFERAGSTTTFEEYVRILVAATDLDDKLGRFISGGPGYLKVVHEKTPEFIKFLTIKADFPGEKS